MVLGPRVMRPSVPRPGGGDSPACVAFPCGGAHDGLVEAHPALPRGIRWRAVGSAVYTRAAFVDGSWWVLRLNDFPEHPMLTLFADGQRITDIDDLPASWREMSRAAESLTADERQQVLDVMRGLGPYGAEAGTPCDGDWCTCSILTDDYAARA